MNWKEFKEEVEGVVPPEGVDINEWEVIITVRGERQHEFAPTGIAYDEDTDNEEPQPFIIIEARRQ